MEVIFCCKIINKFDVLQKKHPIYNEVLEYNLDLIKCEDLFTATYPERGENGLQILAFGTPEEIVKNKKSITGKYLKEKLSLPPKTTMLVFFNYGYEFFKGFYFWSWFIIMPFHV